MDIYLLRIGVFLILEIGLTAIISGLINRKNIGKFLGIFLLIFAIEIITIKTWGVSTALKLYPFHTDFVLIMLIFLIFKLRLYDAIIYTLLAYQSCKIPEYLSRLCDYAFPKNVIIELIVYFVLAVALLLTIYFFIGDSIKKIMGESIIEDIAYGIIPIAYYIFDYVTTVLTNHLYDGNYYYTQFMPFMMSLTYLYFIVFLQKERNRKRKIFEEKSIKERELTIVENEVKNLHNLQEMARIYRHDIRHHFALISSLLVSGNTDDAVKYINENIEVVENVTPMKYCDLEMLNLLFLEYADKAKDNNIDYNFNINLPEKLPLSNIELCALISNIWGYAFDEQMELLEFERFISMSLGYLGEMFIISIEAGINDKVIHDENYGKKSIMAIVNKHEGIAMINDKGLELKIVVSIPI